MANDRISGLSISMDLETAGIDRSMSEIKRSFRGLNSSIKTNTNNLKYGEKSVENYESSISSLTGDIEKQRKNLDDLGQKYREAAADGNENSAAAQKLATEYNKQADNLNYLERQLENATSELREFQKQQELQSSSLFKTGTALTGFGNGLQSISGKAKDVGKSLTKSITLPALGVATAVGGITAAFGWERLVGLDSAQAQLKGLGYNTEEVGRISDQVTSAIEGGMTTMAEGTAVAAGAMAAGVEEGAELEQYITLVGDAAVGANRPVEDMAQIFNRVQGSGKLMTQELNMIEQGMPGFAMAMADNLGVTQEEFRKMVTAGEVGSDEFMDVMEDFAGGMADAYSDSWQGMLANTKAYIGIIGENLLGGVFEKSKESIAEFIEVLKSDAVVTWAEQMGQSIGNMFSNIADKVQGAITWFSNLSKSQQGVIVKFGAVAVAAGPVLVALGTLGGIVGKVSSGLGTLMTTVAKGGGVVKSLGTAFTFLTGPVGLTVGIIAALVAGFTLAYKKSDTFRGIVNKLKDAFLNAVSGITEFLTTNETILAMVDGIKSAFTTMRKKVNQAIGAVVGFFQDKIAVMTSFWDSEGSSFLQAFSNVFGGIWKVVKPVLDAVLGAVKFALPVIKGIFDVTFKAVLEIVKMVWNNIKGVINGGLDIIMGLIKTFSGLFTGDFSKMWEGVKQIFSGAIEFVWNFVQLSFFGKLLKGVTGFIKLFSSPISKMWTGIKTVFSTVIKWIVDFVKNSFTRMSNTITTITTAIRNVISKIWNAILSFFKTVIKSIVDFVKQRFTNLKNNTTNIFTGVRDMAKRVWNKTKDNIVNPIKNGVNWAIKKFKGFKTSVTETFKNIKDNVFGYVSDMIQKVKEMPGNMKDKIVEGAGKLKEGFLDIGQSMIDGMATGVNGVISAVKWVLKKFGIEKNWHWDAPTINAYAKGTRGKHPGGPAIVSDGVGSNSGPELMQDPKGNFSLSPAKPTLIPNMPKGTQVWSATETREALTPQYAWGINFKDVAKALNLGGEAMQYSDSKTNRALGKAASGIGSGLDIYNDAPKALLNAGLKAMGVEVPNFPAAIGKMAKGGFNYVKDKAVGFIKKTQDDELESITGPTSGGASAWRGMIRKAAARMNESITSRHVNGIIAQINRESGGNEKITQSSAVVDINTLSGNPARGLLQYIPQTFAAYKMPGHGNIYSGYDQLLAFFNNKTWRRDLPYGTRGWGPRGGRKFASGGLVKNSGLYELAEGGFPEWVIPTDPKRRTDAMKLLALAGKDIESGNKRPRQLPNVSGSSGNDNRYLETVVDKLTQQVQLLTELVVSNRDIANKPVLSEGDIKRSFNKMDSKDSINHGIFTGRPGGAY